MREAITFTEIQTWLTCRTQHSLLYRHQVEPQGSEYGPKEFGHDIHCWRAMLDTGEPLNKVTDIANSRFEPIAWEFAGPGLYKQWGLALGYLELLNNRKMQWQALEQPFEVPILNNGYAHPSYNLAGKIDGVTDDNALYELKVTSHSTEMLMRVAQTSWQPQLYAYALYQLTGSYPDRFIYEVLRSTCNLRLKRKQEMADYAAEVRQYVIDNPGDYHFTTDLIPVINPNAAQFLWDMAEELAADRPPYRNASTLTCPRCDFRHECLTGDITGNNRKVAKHTELT